MGNGPIDAKSNRPTVPTPGPKGINDSSDPDRPVAVPRSPGHLDADRSTSLADTDEDSPADRLMDIVVKGYKAPFGLFGVKSPPGAGVLGGVKNAVNLANSDASVEERVTAGVAIVGALVETYAGGVAKSLPLQARRTAAYGAAKRLLMVARGIEFGLAAWEIVSMVGRGYEAGHEIARSEGYRSGFLYGVAAAIVCGNEVSVSGHLTKSVSKDFVPGNFEFSYARGNNVGIKDGINAFMNLSEAQQEALRTGVYEIMKANGSYQYFLRRKRLHGASEAVTSALRPVYKILMPVLEAQQARTRKAGGRHIPGISAKNPYGGIGNQ